MPFVPNIGPGELILILIIALVILGPGRLPDVAQSLGKSVREFRRAATDVADAGKLDPGVGGSGGSGANPGSPDVAAGSTPSSPTAAPARATEPAATPVGAAPGPDSDANRPAN